MNTTFSQNFVADERSNAERLHAQISYTRPYMATAIG